jgi:hypothetical protein
MEKLSTHYLLGQAQAFMHMGIPEEQVKVAFEQRYGLSSADAESLVKEANPLALLGAGIRFGGRALAGGAANLARRGGAQLMKGNISKAFNPTMLGRAGGLMRQGLGGTMQAVGRTGLKAGRGLASSGRAFQAAPLQSLGRGAVEAGKGALFMGGKGVGGVIGKGMFGASMASMLGGGGGQQGTPQMQMPQPYGGSMMRYPQQAGRY